MHAAHGCFVKARPARPTSTRLRSRRARQPPSAVQSSRRRKRTRNRADASRGRLEAAMAHATKCAAPEGNRGRDEWMTVIEMQEYMGGEPKQGVRPHLVGRDRLVQARQEDPGFEVVRGRLHRVEERQKMTAATALGAARGRAREGAPRDERSSRTTMTKSISRRQVRPIVSSNAIFGADEACAMLRIRRDAMYRLAKDPDAPFPSTNMRIGKPRCSGFPHFATNENRVRTPG